MKGTCNGKRVDAEDKACSSGITNSDIHPKVCGECLKFEKIGKAIGKNEPFYIDVEMKKQGLDKDYILKRGKGFLESLFDDTFGVSCEKITIRRKGIRGLFPALVFNALSGAYIIEIHDERLRKLGKMLYNFLEKRGQIVALM